MIHFLTCFSFSSFFFIFQVRLSVLQSLTPEFDRYLARAQHVSTLLLLLADEVRHLICVCYSAKHQLILRTRRSLTFFLVDFLT